MVHLRLALIISLLTACGGSITSGNGSPDGPVAPIEGLTAIAITPPIANLIIDGDTPAELDYTAVGTFEDGHKEDVTNRVGWYVANAAIGTFTHAHFKSSTFTGGHTQVYARAATITTYGTLSVTLKKRVMDPDSTDLPADPSGKFTGTADDSRKPDVVYPNDGVLLPPNLGIIEVHFLPGAANTLFEIDFTNAVTDIRVFARCTHPLNDGCIYTPQGGIWGWLATTNGGGEPVQISVRGTDDTGARVGTSTSIGMAFSQDAINGGIYYWTTYGGSQIMRFDFAGTDTVATPFVDGAIVDGHCVGCHALSSDGKKMVAEIQGQNDGRNIILDVTNVTAIAALGSTEKSIFESWNPDATMYVGVYGDDNATDFNLLLMDGTTGQKMGHIDVGGTKQGNAADHPDWSPDGTRIAFTQVGADSYSMQRQYQGAIRMVTQNGASWTAETLVDHGPAGTNHYYPAFSPATGELVAFDTSVCSDGQNSEACDGDTDPTAKLFIMKPQQGAPVIELARANAPGKNDGSETRLTNTFPKWSPFVFHRVAGEDSSRLMWITFSTTRHVGLRPAPPPGSGGEGGNLSGTYIWMAAIDPDTALSGLDPSYPAFYLPFQDATTSNHIAQWTKVVSKPIP